MNNLLCYCGRLLARQPDSNSGGYCSGRKPFRHRLLIFMQHLLGFGYFSNISVREESIKVEDNVIEVGVKYLILSTRFVAFLSLERIPVLDSYRKRGICHCSL